MTILNDWQIKDALKGFVQFLWSADEITAWESGFELTGLHIKKDKKGWLLIVKVYNGSQPLVCFNRQPSYWRTIFAFGWNLKYGVIQWKRDKWP